jgi:hypothetical protein
MIAPHIHDVARFAAIDDPELVVASFCCRLCVRRPAFVVVGVGAERGEAYCYCPACDCLTNVALNSEQLIRLRHSPPRAVQIHVIADDGL